MKWQYRVFDATVGPGDAIHVSLRRPANVLLLTATEHEKYKTGEEFTYTFGGWRGPVGIQWVRWFVDPRCALYQVLLPPTPGRWIAVVDVRPDRTGFRRPGEAKPGKPMRRRLYGINTVRPHFFVMPYDE